MSRMGPQALNNNILRDSVLIKNIQCVSELGVRKSIRLCKLLPQIFMTNPLSSRTRLTLCEINPGPTLTKTHLCIYEIQYLPSQRLKRITVKEMRPSVLNIMFMI